MTWELEGSRVAPVTRLHRQYSSASMIVMTRLVTAGPSRPVRSRSSTLRSLTSAISSDRQAEILNALVLAKPDQTAPPSIQSVRLDDDQMRLIRNELAKANTKEDA
jgi:hypothetical protein